MEKPLVSVIIPSYNHENYVEECIRSVFSQDYKNIELIVIDDGSIDGSVDKIQSLKEFFSFTFIAKENEGLVKTLKKAINLSTGKYISFLASDDVWYKEKLSRQVVHMEGKVAAKACCANVGVIDEFGNIRKNNKRWLIEEFDFKRVMLDGYNIPPATLLFRKEVFDASFLDSSLKVEDLFLWLKLTEDGGTIDVLPEVLALYRSHSTNTTNNLAMIASEHHKILDRFSHAPIYKKAKIVWCKFSFRQLSGFNKREACKYLALKPSFIFSKPFLIGVIKLAVVSRGKA